MKVKKILVVYYSRSGLCKKVAEDIAVNLSADIEEIKTDSTYQGVWGYQRAILEGIFKSHPKINELKSDLNNYDLVIIGGPTWAGRIASPLRTFLSEYKRGLKSVAFFNTQTGNMGYKSIIGQMKTITSLKPLAALSLNDQEITEDNYKDSMNTFISKLGDKGSKNKRLNPKKSNSFPIIHAQIP